MSNALALNSGTIRDAALNNAILTHSVVSDHSSYKVDTTAPSVDYFALSDTMLHVGETATVILSFSEEVCAVTWEPSGCYFSQTGGTNFSNDDITVWDALYNEQQR
jgi:hypothetical protein